MNYRENLRYIPCDQCWDTCFVDSDTLTKFSDGIATKPCLIR